MSAGVPRVLAIDQGTSATKCILLDERAAILTRATAPLGQTHPHPGWVEQDADAIWTSVCDSVQRCLRGYDARAVTAIGLSTQRESIVAWHRATGRPASPVLSWQDQRTGALCDALRTPSTERFVRERSGLPLDPMFSASKISWLLDALDPDRRKARGSRLCFGTIDSWLMSRLCGEYTIEAGNASRTQLMNTRNVAWDDDLLELFDVPVAALPRIVPSTGPFPAIAGLPSVPPGARVHSILGDSHAALFGHGAFEPGQVKATYGTGSSVMGLIGAPADLDAGLCLTIAWLTDKPAFAAEGNIRATGSAVRWLADLFGVSSEELAELGATGDAHGVALVPAFTGLGAPWWDRDAVGIVTGVTHMTGRRELARAALDAVVQQIADVVEAIDASVAESKELFTDGGPTRNGFLMQLQADVLGRPVLRASDPELSALGTAHLAGVAAGLWSWDHLRRVPRRRDIFEPGTDEIERRSGRRAWHEAVERARFRPVAAQPPDSFVRS